MQKMLGHILILAFWGMLNVKPETNPTLSAVVDV